MIFDTLQEIRKTISLEALDRNIPVEMYGYKMKPTELISFCQLCGIQLKFELCGELWMTTSLAITHQHEPVYRRIKINQIEDEAFVVATYTFPCTIKVGDTFVDRKGIKDRCVREALERNLPINIYAFGNIRLSCKICAS